MGWNTEKTWWVKGIRWRCSDEWKMFGRPGLSKEGSQVCILYTLQCTYFKPCLVDCVKKVPEAAFFFIVEKAVRFSCQTHVYTKSDSKFRRKCSVAHQRNYRVLVRIDGPVASWLVETSWIGCLQLSGY